MRSLFVVLAGLALAQCASPGGDDFLVGREERGLVVIGLAEAARTVEPAYTMLWRRLELGTGEFEQFDGDTSFEARTNAGNTARVRGVPGEFTVVELPPGTYALDSIFAEIHDRRVSYFANGVIQGPQRPAFELRAGEAVYLGIWQAQLIDNSVLVAPWRLDMADASAVLTSRGGVSGQVRPRETFTVSATCAPRRLNSLTQRQIC
jgi:hypothetical protein